MPRRVIPPTVAAPVPPQPLSPLVQKLRQDYRWAGISQFIFTFSDAFGLVDWDIEALEKDMDGTEDMLVPDLISKLLVALTWNRQINRQNAFENLRKQYLKRDPDHNVLGTLEEPVEWAALGLDQKVQILWQLCEWQLVEPARFRSLLKTEEEAPSWRVDPVGWDKHGNTYFLFDDNRLWIQRARPLPPRPQKKSSQKAKKALRAQRKANPPPKRSHKKREPPTPVKAPESTPPPPSVPLLDAPPIVSGTRQRKQVVFYGNVVPTVEALKRGGPTTPSPSKTDRPLRSTRTSAAAASPAKPPPPLPRGTRVSRRLRPVEDDWQQVPEEWLNGSSSKAGGGDDESELSDLTDEEEHEATVQATLGSPVKNETAPGPDIKSDSPLSEAPEAPTFEPTAEPEPEPELEPKTEAEPEFEPAAAEDEPMKEEPQAAEEPESEEEPEVDEFEEMLKHTKNVPEGFIEWEAVCVSLYDWQTFPEQWAKSKHPDEKALYKVLTEDVGPQIIEVLQAKEVERIKQEAINNRKRSSRIATRELEKAEQLRRETAEREMEERMERLRQEEEQKAREEAEAQERERAREARLREREERQIARQQAIMARAEAEAREREKAERKRERRKRRRDGEEVESSSDEESPAQTPGTTGSGQNSWELRCEVCKQHGWNLKDTDDLVSCDDCGRWQHVNCHDRQDIAAGRAIRDWDTVDFRCKECEQRTEAKRRRIEEPKPSNTPPTTASAPPQQRPPPVPSPQAPYPQPANDVRPAPPREVPPATGVPHIGQAPYLPQPPHAPVSANGHASGYHTTAHHSPPSYQGHPHEPRPLPSTPMPYYSGTSPHSGTYQRPPHHSPPYHSPPHHAPYHGSHPYMPQPHHTVPPPSAPPPISTRPAPYHPPMYPQPYSPPHHPAPQRQLHSPSAPLHHPYPPLVSPIRMDHPSHGTPVPPRPAQHTPSGPPQYSTSQ